MKEYDVIVIGAGGGVKLVLPAADLGYKVALVEKERAGGTCLNRGCIPSKMLIHPADVMTIIREARRFGISVFDVQADFSGMVQWVSKTVDQESASIPPNYYKHPNVDYYNREARFVSENVLMIDGQRITAKKIFLAVGARPNIPPIKGLEKTPYMTYREALRNTKRPEKLLVIGGGYIAAELGFFYGALGTKVQFLVRSELLRKEDRDIRKEFARVFEKKFSVHYGWHPLEVSFQDNAFHLQCQKDTGEKGVFTSDALLVVTGVVPWTDSLGLEHTGIEIDACGYIKVDDYLQTTQPGVWAFGDCIGRYLYRHTANFEGEYLFRTLFKEPSREPIAYPPVPHAIFSHPQIGSVGKKEDDLTREGREYIVGKNNYADSAMGMALRSDYGFAKLLFDKKDRTLIGAHIIGEEASDMIHMLIAFMYKKATVDDLNHMIYIHPALPEIVRNAARKALKAFEKQEDS
ncbi:MAG: dihydrolipoyl dehydrogenase [Simkaniaceae bacterium]